MPSELLGITENGTGQQGRRPLRVSYLRHVARDAGFPLPDGSDPGGGIRHQGGHRLGQLAGGHVSQRHALKDGPLRGPEGDPDLLQSSGGTDVLKVLGAAAADVGQFTVQRADDIGDADIRGGPGQPVTAVRTALAAQQTAAPRSALGKAYDDVKSMSLFTPDDSDAADLSRALNTLANEMDNQGFLVTGKPTTVTLAGGFAAAGKASAAFVENVTAGAVGAAASAAFDLLMTSPVLVGIAGLIAWRVLR